MGAFGHVNKCNFEEMSSAGFNMNFEISLMHFYCFYDLLFRYLWDIHIVIIFISIMAITDCVVITRAQLKNTNS